MGKKKKKFEYLTGDEIFATKDTILNEINSKKYNDFCEQINTFWKKKKIEDQLYAPLGVATVKTGPYYTAECCSFLKKNQVCRKEISASDLANIIDNGNALAENAVYMAKNKYDKFWDIFSFESDLFDRFISENGFYWNIGIQVTKVGRSSFLDSNPCIYAFEYVLFIACNDDDNAITSIKLGLEGTGMDKIQKVPKKMGFWEALNWHKDTFYIFTETILPLILLVIMLCSLIYMLRFLSTICI